MRTFRQIRWTFSIRGMMIAVALVALNYVGAEATRRAWPTDYYPMSGRRTGWLYFETRADGSKFIGNFHPITGIRSPPRLVRPPRPTPLQSSSPAIACLSITFLALILAWKSRRFPRVRQILLLLVLTASLISSYQWWVLYGGWLPLNRLELDMTKPEVLAIVGPPNPEGSNENIWLITRPGSLYWLELRFNEAGRLRAYPPNGYHLHRSLLKSFGGQSP